MYRELHPVTYYFYPLLEHDKGQSSESWNHFESILASKPPGVTDNLLYIHIPFCHDLCRFCPFHVKVPNSAEVYARYTKALVREMELISRLPYVGDMSFKSVYFGGGSPSILSNDQIRMIFQGMYRWLNIAEGAEITFEGEPDTLGEPEKLDMLKEFGVVRISFGLQTYKQELRELFNIRATLDHIDRVTQNARERGFKDINVDMMYDLPGQTLEDLAYDLRHLEAHGFDSVDYYNLHYFAFPQKMKQEMANGKLPSKPSQEMHFTLAKGVMDGMKKMGYHHLADQIFARYPELCEYFRVLWGGGKGQYAAETIAIGASARGYLNGFAYMNQSNTHKYMSLVEEGESVFSRISGLLDDPRNRGIAFLAKFFQLDPKHAGAWYQTVSAEKRNYLTGNGYVEESEAGICLTDEGKLWTTNVMLDLFEPRQVQLAKSSTEALEVKAGARTGSF